MNNDENKWNEVKETQKDIEISINKLWRKQFLKNPFKLGLYGVLMLIIWISFAGYWIYGVYMTQTELTSAGYHPSTNNTAAYFSAAIMVGVLWIFTLMTSPFFAKRTVQRFKSKGKNFEEIIEGK